MMEQDVLIEVSGLGKKFSRNLRRSLLYGFSDVIKAVFGMGKKQRSNLRKHEFWAVRNVSFTVRRGECLGLIGHNGAGKSTLLKMLNGLIRPDEGSIVMRGRVGALIELGTGFNPILTGRENIYINGQILGFTKTEIDAKLESIIDFSEIRDFIDSPVQTYSSGMKVRLGFAVAAQMEPDVLIIDEVLAVGDVGFRGKCLKVISEMMSKAAVIFVSHSMPIVNRYCNRGILMSKGKLAVDSFQVQDAIEAYLNSFESGSMSQKFDSGQLVVREFTFNGSDLLQTSAKINVFAHCEFRVVAERIENSLEIAQMRLNLIDRNLALVGSVVSDKVTVKDNQFVFSYRVGPFNIQPGGYKMSLVLFGKDLHDPILIHEGVYSINVEGTTKDYGGNPVLFHIEQV
jgi:lipopolysaccharide transport system ATP-binding protein